ncbi:cytochrome bc1 complex Rieske iron-sulfur subunit [Nocardioides terrisoli]|uniref:cytochrome bc1 complex Rieske iron-sulfur subunit n=1 Tax=Nocardioides terrisoli TaxID=3388267 RepID=UPI00287B7764|nr:Rieske 2Fe-2S domain-containing protein [Nocardioides marmorisolisilvae]
MSDNQNGHGHELEQITHEPIADPGLPPHEPRPTDVDPAAERRAERQVAMLFGLSVIFAILFCVAYFAFSIGEHPTVILGLGASNVVLGLCLGLALLCIGIGAIQWARKLMSDHEIVEYRHSASSSDEDRAEAVAAFTQGVEESGIGRRPLIRNSLLVAMGALGLPAIVALRDLGPLPGHKLYETVWRKGMRVVQDVGFNPIKPGDLEVGQLVNCEPEVFDPKNLGPDGKPKYEGTALLQQTAKAAVILVRMDPDDITPAKDRENWGINGILCYSKICTHVGCPISLWEQQTHHLLCPCHQSTFDLGDNGKVVFGPAARPLPQLPITVDSEGYIVAQSGFHEPVGPSFWERG